MPTFTSPAFEYGAPYPVYSYSCPNNRNDFILIIVLFILLIIVGGSFFCDSKC
ncbi:YjcZ family sporulation protein [Cytobacillus praedii]|uniref:YjcZ family sporulation protein n=2 Tax=Cytobacillus praedii TaxID=1742358 RepID=A0A4V2NTP5_9BACI|nr:YjcZ family sporulation protein [Cytobacillus praedii]MED3550241.1 YjcZ family sporulation protein [Cytobacillus praedii]TCJ00984.1 YjcZ family sporulation protein [Cytobacillus praedii]